MSDIPNAIGGAVFTLFGVPLRCFILDNGQRVIHEDDVTALLAVMNSDGPVPTVDAREVEAFALWRAGCSGR
jgi:hypothetical protein